MPHKLNEANFLSYAMKSYNSSVVSIEEFQEDLHRFKYIKKLLNRYDETGEIKIRLVLNHLIVLSNVFTPPITFQRMIVLKLFPHLSQIKPFMITLNIWNEGKIDGVDNIYDLYGSDIPLDQKIVHLLREEFKGFRI